MSLGFRCHPPAARYTIPPRGPSTSKTGSSRCQKGRCPAPGGRSESRHHGVRQVIRGARRACGSVVAVTERLEMTGAAAELPLQFW